MDDCNWLWGFGWPPTVSQDAQTHSYSEHQVFNSSFFFFWLRLNCLRFPLRPFHIGYDYRDMASLVSVAVSIGAGSVWLNNPDNCPNFQYAVLRSSWSKFSCFLLQCTCDGR